VDANILIRCVLGEKVPALLAAHAALMAPAALETNALPSRWATRVQRPRCVPSSALSSLSQARSLSAMCRMAGACVAVSIGSSRAGAAG
jgi:hypothetical protein